VFLVYHRSATRRDGEQQLAAVVARLDETDPPWRLADLQADHVVPPGEQDGAQLIPRFRALGRRPFTPRRADGRTVEFEPPNRRPDADDVAAINAVLEGQDGALAIARSFVKTTGGHFSTAIAPTYIHTLLPNQGAMRDVYDLLDTEAEWLCWDGRPAAALHLVRTILAAARSLDGDVFLTSASIRMRGDRLAVRRAERILAQRVTATGLAEVQTALARQVEADAFWPAVRGERAGMNELFGELRAGRFSFTAALEGPLSPPRPLDPKVLVNDWIADPYLPTEQATFLDYLTRFYAVRSLPDHAQRAALAGIVPVGRGTQFAREWARGLRNIHDTNLRTKAVLRCGTAGIAVERYRLRLGRWPAALTDIPADLLPAVPLDPFDGKPLRFVTRTNGVTVYSIGQDGKDDGGADANASTNRQNGDVVFRLYDPDQRGLILPDPQAGTAGGGLAVRGFFPEALPMPRVVWP